MEESLSWRIIIFPSGKNYLSFLRGFFMETAAELLH